MLVYLFVLVFESVFKNSKRSILFGETQTAPKSVRLCEVKKNTKSQAKELNEKLNMHVQDSQFVISKESSQVRF